MSNFELPPAEDYTGPSSNMRNSRWLSGEEIPVNVTIPVTIEIAKIRRSVKFPNQSEPTDIYSLKLVGKQKEVKINATIRAALEGMFGTDTAAWRGKRIGLQRILGMVGGKRTPMVDVVPISGTGAPAQPPKEDPAPEADDAHDPGDMSQIPF